MGSISSSKIARAQPVDSNGPGQLAAMSAEICAYFFSARQLAFRCALGAGLILITACGRSDLAGIDSTPEVGQGGATVGGSGGQPPRGADSGAGISGSGGGGSQADAGVGGISADGGPPTMPIGNTPWRDAPGTFCGGNIGPVDSFDVWSDTRGVFALMTSASVSLVFANDGSGWQEILRSPSENLPTRLSGFPGGPLVKYGGFQCGVRLITNGEESCSAAVNGVTSFFAVTPSLAFATSGDRVIEYDGEFWTQRGSALEPQGRYALSVWGRDNDMLVGATEALYASNDTGVLEPEAELPLGNYVSVWGAPEVAWTGSHENLWLRENASWNIAWTAREGCSDAVKFLWGDQDSLFFATSSLFGVHDATGVRVIAEWPCHGPVHISGMWGNSVAEVFVSLRDDSLRDTDCGEAFLLWYDGVRLNAL